MNKCKVCEVEYDAETSKLTLNQLREVSYDPKLLTDSNEPDFYCSKWCEKKDAGEVAREEGLINVLIPQTVYSPTLGKEVSMGKRAEKELARHGVVRTDDIKDSPMAQMQRDSKMVSMIKDGKGSDKGISREAHAIQREYESKRKQALRERDHKELYQMKKERGLLPEQLRARTRS